MSIEHTACSIDGRCRFAVEQDGVCSTGCCRYMAHPPADAITSFDGEHAFLSNFYPCRFLWNHFYWPTVEHAYQAAKAKMPTGFMAVRACKTANQAKMKGRQIAIREDWEQTKLDVMLMLLRRKFADHGLRQQLIDTGTAMLIEGNTWRDTYWGVCGGRGENHLGRLLMQVRQEVAAC